MLNTEEISYVVSHSGAKILLAENNLVNLVEKRKNFSRQ